MVVSITGTPRRFSFFYLDIAVPGMSVAVSLQFLVFLKQAVTQDTVLRSTKALTVSRAE